MNYKIFTRNNYFFIVDENDLQYEAHRSDVLFRRYYQSSTDFLIENVKGFDKKKKVPFSNILDENGDPYNSLSDFVDFYEKNTGNKSGGSAGDLGSVLGFIDYNDATGDVNLLPNVWTDVPNDGLGPFTNKTYKPTSINEVMDNNTGYLDFSELSLGSQITMRNDMVFIPSVNNSLLQIRYLLGQGEGEYPLLFWSERLDNGSGIDYQRVPIFKIYMGDLNTKNGVGKLQVKLSSPGILRNAGTYIDIQIR